MKITVRKARTRERERENRTFLTSKHWSALFGCRVSCQVVLYVAVTVGTIIINSSLFQPLGINTFGAASQAAKDPFWWPIDKTETRELVTFLVVPVSLDAYFQLDERVPWHIFCPYFYRRMERKCHNTVMMALVSAVDSNSNLTLVFVQLFLGGHWLRFLFSSIWLFPTTICNAWHKRQFTWQHVNILLFYSIWFPLFHFRIYNKRIHFSLSSKKLWRVFFFDVDLCL